MRFLIAHTMTLAATATLAVAASAEAAPVDVKVLTAGPVVAGETVVWGELRGGGIELRSASLDGGPRRVLARLGRPETDEAPGVQSIFLHGAPDGYAALVITASPGFKGEGGAILSDTVLSGQPGAPPRAVASCDAAGSTVRGADDLWWADRARGAVVSRVRSCGRGPASLEIRSPADAGEPVRRLPVTSGSLSASYFAYREATVGDPGRFVVYDWRRGEEAYSVSLREVTGDGSVTDLEVADDGRIAFVISSGDRAEVWTASAAAPRPERLGLSAGDIRLSGSALGFSRYGERGGEVGTYDFRTGRTTTVTDGLTGGFEISTGVFDLQGDTVVWQAPRCDRVVLRVGRVGRRSPPDVRPRCPLPLDGRPRVRGRRVRVAFGCSRYARYICPGRVTMRTADRRRLLLARGRTDGSSERPDHERAVLRLTSTGRRLLRDKPRRRVIVTAMTRVSPGRIERRSARTRPVVG